MLPVWLLARRRLPLRSSMKTEKAPNRRKQLAGQGIHTATDLALWARRHGLLSVYLELVTPMNVKDPSSYWQVVRPGYETDPDDSAHMGNKAFPATTTAERVLALQDAVTWLSLTYGVEQWVGVAGFPNCLFPIDTARALREVCPSVVISNVKGRLKLSKSL